MATSSSSKKTIQIGNEALDKIGLPPVEVVSQDPQVQFAYGILGQCLNAFKAGKNLTPFVQKLLERAITDIAVLSATPVPPSPQNYDSCKPWYQWLWDTEAVQSGFATLKTRAAASPPILKFLAGLAKLHDARAILDVKDALKMDLAQARRSAPPMHNECESVYLLFYMPKSPGSANPDRPLLLAELYPQPSTQFMRAYGPNKSTRLTPSAADLFHSNGESRGNYDEATLAEVLGRELQPAAVASWTGFFAEIDARCQELFSGPLHEVTTRLFGDHSPALNVLVVDAAKVRPKKWGIIYEELINGKRVSTTVNTAVQGVQAPEQVRLANCCRGQFLGHMDTRTQAGQGREPAYPLDPTQRLAAMQAGLLDTTLGHCILPVNGPPGSGKTSFLRAVLASQWVAAALAQAAHPPIVFGTGATNKAVSNMIDAFKDVPGLPDAGVDMTTRWLDGLPSYGWYFPSQKGVDDYPGMMHLTWNDAYKSPFSPSGGAQTFATLTHTAHALTYLSRARAVLELPVSSQPSVAAVVATLHQRIKRIAAQMQGEQNQFEIGLTAFALAWRAARGSATPTREQARQLRALQAQAQQVVSTLQALEPAAIAATLYLREARQLLTGWRSLLPRLFFGKRLSDLAALADTANANFIRAGLNWTTVLPALEANLAEVHSQMASLAHENAKLSDLTFNGHLNLRHLIALREKRQAAWRALHALMRELPLVPAWDRATIRHARVYAVQNLDADERHLQALDMLWARFDERQDLAYRLALFHLSARYWEGRWLQTQTDEVASKVTDETRLQQLMMLGVIVVATTDKLYALGERSTCDVLIMDEAGQCAPEVAVGALAFARKAVFVGDTKQLQPLGNLPGQMVNDLVKQAGMATGALPREFSPNGGSAMAIAQRAAAVTDQSDDAGMTLLYHYRCHPAIIGYCNELLYGGKMHFVRSDKPTVASLPPMAWVDVGSAEPQRCGSSWVNEGELEEIAKWILDSHTRLVKAYKMPLDKVLAVITPLAAQAQLAKQFLLKKLGPVLGDSVVEAMTIGTVHSLQGAEKPVIAFSLVQQRHSNQALFADRDGGFLMNVAVSRAKDSFIVFADRKSLQGAKADAAMALLDGKPISRLGAYMRDYGSRLYPRTLVIVEAPGKVDSVKTALGLSAEVVATRGSLRQAWLGADGGLQWSPSPPEFMDKLRDQHAMVDEVFVATDDDLAGELIGMHAAQDCALALGTVKVKRMRFHAVTTKDLQLALQAAGPLFDANLLAAALVREYARLWDERHFTKLMPVQGYIGMAKRDLLACVNAMTSGAAQWTAHATLEDTRGATYRAFVPKNPSALAEPLTFDSADAAEAALQMASAKEGQTLEPQGQSTATQLPSLYPPSTTLQMLALAADRLGMMPWETQAHLNALYQEGARQ